MQKSLVLAISLLMMILMTSCKPSRNDISDKDVLASGVSHPDWVKDAVIYELNVRQYSEKGNFKAVEGDLDRLKGLGVDILWLMPINPIGEKNRKGELGSYYSVKDYYGINPEYGSMSDFESLVHAIHEQGMKIIIDWVPNHTSWDNQLATQHPEFYIKDNDGEFKSPFDWTDVIQLDYDQKGLRDYMIDALKFWIKEADIDGFRFDVAHMIPVDFFEAARDSLMKIKDVFLLAEADQPKLHEKAMDMSYDWRLHHIMNEVAIGNQTVIDIKDHFTYVDSAYPAGSILMEFTSNHDENSWNGTAYERLGDAVNTFAVFSFIIPGMPLIYNGQEACLDKRLKFFVKDPIQWQDCDMTDLYKSLCQLKKKSKALWIGDKNSKFQFIDTEHPEKVLVLKRINQGDTLIAVFNLSDENLDLNVSGFLTEKELVEYFSQQTFNPGKNGILKMKPWEYKVYLK